LAVFEDFALAAFLAAGLAALPQGFLAHPPFCAITLTSLHFKVEVPFSNQTRDVSQASHVSNILNIAVTVRQLLVNIPRSEIFSCGTRLAPICLELPLPSFGLLCRHAHV